jgi:hypothetical protein
MGRFSFLDAHWLTLTDGPILHGIGQAVKRTHNDTANPAILRLNEKLGYRRLPGWLAWEKPVCP